MHAVKAAANVIHSSTVGKWDSVYERTSGGLEHASLLPAGCVRVDYLGAQCKQGRDSSAEK